MESTQSIKRRIKSVKNISQITKAMELVAATKMRQSEEVALNSRPYAYSALEILAALSRIKEDDLPEFLTGRPVKRRAFLLVTSDRGLAGSFNSAIIRLFERHLAASNQTSADNVFIAVGNKAKQYLERRKMNLLGAFGQTSNFVDPQEVKPISDFLIKGFLKGEFDELTAFSTIFLTALNQEARSERLLPIDFNELKKAAENLKPRAGKYADFIDLESYSSPEAADYITEPSAQEVFEALAPELLRIRLYDLFMEANASEHAARRLAMKNASDNAEDLSINLNLFYNKSRQAAITREIIEVTSATAN